MPYPRNTLSVVGAKIKRIDTRYTMEGKLICDLACYEYQGSKNDKPEGIWHNLALWEKTAEIFVKENPEENDRVSFNGSLVDRSFVDKDGKTVARVGVRVNNIQLSKKVKEEEF